MRSAALRGIGSRFQLSLGSSLSLLYLLASLYVYISLIYQISARTPEAFGADAATARRFGLLRQYWLRC